MKKLVVSIFAVVLLAGCGGGDSTPKVESKTCSQSEDGMKMDAKFDATDNKVTKATIDVIMDLTALDAGVDLTKMTDEQKAALGDQVATGMGLKKGEGVEVAIDFKDNDMVVKLIIDIEKGDPAVLKALDLDVEKGMKLSEVVKGAEKEGATCK